MIKVIGIAIFCASLAWFFVFQKHPLLATLIGVLAIIWFFMLLKKKQDVLEENFQRRFSGRNIRYLDKCAIFRARVSNGYSQSQGKGYLVLTDDELHFKMTLLNIEIQIPASSIIRAGKTNRLLGVNPGGTMLKVDFKDIDGEDDAIALSVNELDTWIKEITEIIGEDA